MCPLQAYIAQKGQDLIGLLLVDSNYNKTLASDLHMCTWCFLKKYHQHLKCPLHNKFCLHGHTKSFCMHKICP